MGFSLKKAIRGVRNTVKAVASPVTRVTEAVLKPVARPLRPVISKAVPFVPGLNLPALVLPAKSFGITSERGVAGFERSQKVSRVGTAAVGVVGAGLLAPQGVLPAAYKVMQSSAPSLLGGGAGPTDVNVPGGEWIDPSTYAPSPAWPARPSAPGLPGGSGAALAIGGIVAALFLAKAG